MSKFDQQYIDFLKSHEEEFKKYGYLGFTSVFDAYVEWIEGKALCDCGHGCQFAIVDNAAKLAFIMASAAKGASQQTLDELALRDPKLFAHDLHENMWKEAKERSKRRASKN